MRLKGWTLARAVATTASLCAPPQSPSLRVFLGSIYYRLRTPKTAFDLLAAGGGALPLWRGIRKSAMRSGPSARGLGKVTCQCQCQQRARRRDPENPLKGTLRNKNHVTKHSKRKRTDILVMSITQRSIPSNHATQLTS